MTQQKHQVSNTDLPTGKVLHSDLDPSVSSLGDKDCPPLLTMLLNEHIVGLSLEGYDTLQQENAQIQSDILRELDRIQKSEAISIGQDVVRSRQLKLLDGLSYMLGAYKMHSALIKEKAAIIIRLAHLLKVMSLSSSKLHKEFMTLQQENMQLQQQLDSACSDLELQRNRLTSLNKRMAEEESIQTNLSNTLTQTEPEPAVVMGTQVQAETNTIDVQTTQIQSQLSLQNLASLFIAPNNAIEQERSRINSSTKTESHQAIQTQNAQASSSYSQTTSDYLSTPNISVYSQTRLFKLSISHTFGVDFNCGQSAAQRDKFRLQDVLCWQFEGRPGAKLETEMTDEEETISKMNFIPQESDDGLFPYLRELSSCESEVEYNETAIKRLEQLGEHSLIPKAFARLLKQHKCLKVCLNKLLEKDHEQEEINNARIIGLLEQSSSSSQQSQCIIF